MKAVNEQSKILLDKLWGLAEKTDYYKLNNDPTYIPLTVEIIGNNQLSICHYEELNGDLMRDPEMVFYKKDNDWFPIYFRNDWAGAEEFSGTVIRGQLVANDEERQRHQAEFANTWLLNIKDQQQLH